MRRYFYEGAIATGTTLALQGDLFHHIFDVCRLQVGQHFELLSDDGRAFLVVVESIGKKQAQVLVEEERILPMIKKPHLHLFLCFPKIPTFEAVVEKSVEMGVLSITPVLSDFSFVRTTNQFPTAKVPRWQKIILQATQQSGRGDRLKIENVTSLESAISNVKNMSNALSVIAYEGLAPLSLKAYLAKHSRPGIERINIFVGSEGGFSDAEIQRFKDLDLPPVTLGDQVLRVETACVTLVASLKYEFDLLS